MPSENAETSDSESVFDVLMSRLNIHVSGGTGPKRSEPIECFRPVHQAYERPAHTDINPIGGSIRCLDTKSHHAIVYDRDVVATWRMPSTMAAYEIFF